jgi:hypothetical protein
VAAILAASIPELADFDVKPFTNHLDLEKDQVPVSNPTLVVAVAGGKKQGNMPGADVLIVVFLAVVPGLDQAVRRQDGLDALFALKGWIQDTSFVYDRIQTDALHPVFIGALYADIVG